MKRAVVVLMLLTAALAAQGAPENDVATNIEDSECYDCHKSGGEGAGPVLNNAFRIFLAEAPRFEVGETTTLTFDMRNWWTSRMSDFSGHLDISGAPDFSFNAAKPPVGGEKVGSLPAWSELEFIQNEERTARVTMDVEAGGSLLDWSVTPQEDSGADIEVRLWTPGQNPDVSSPTIVDREGSDGAETGSISGNPVEGGTYTIEVAESPSGVFGFESLAAVGFTLNWTLAYDFDAGASTQIGASNDVLDGQADGGGQPSTQISWSVSPYREMDQEQHIYVYMEAISYYDHPPQFRASDEWLYFEEVNYYFVPQDDGSIQIQRLTPKGERVTEFIVGDQVIEVGGGQEEGPDLTEEKDVPLDAAAEVIGFTTAFLLVLSMLTGGAFGNWSRKVQQWLVYRRAKKRVAYHNLISYALWVLATVHMVLFLVEPKYPWPVGMFLGGMGIFGIYLSALTGIFQKPMVRALGHEGWRWLHHLSFVLAFGGAAAHILLDGIHFSELQETIAWEDPVAPALEDLFAGDDAGN